MPRFLSIALAGVVALASGCAGPPHGDLAVEYHPGEKTQTLRTPYDATYELFAITEYGVWETPIDRASIQQDKCVGFVQELDGSLVGYAAGRKIPLPEGSYRWQITSETRQPGIFGSGETGTRLLVAIAIVPVKIGEFLVWLAPQFLYGLAKSGH